MYSSLVPVDCLKEFESNWEEFYNKSTSTRFNMALQESRDPEKFKQFERAAILTQVESSPVKVPSTIDREPSGAEQSSGINLELAVFSLIYVFSEKEARSSSKVKVDQQQIEPLIYDQIRYSR